MYPAGKNTIASNNALSVVRWLHTHEHSAFPSPYPLSILFNERCFPHKTCNVPWSPVNHSNLTFKACTWTSHKIIHFLVSEAVSKDDGNNVTICSSKIANVTHFRCLRRRLNTRISFGISSRTIDRDARKRSIFVTR